MRLYGFGESAIVLEYRRNIEHDDQEILIRQQRLIALQAQLRSGSVARNIIDCVPGTISEGGNIIYKE